MFKRGTERALTGCPVRYAKGAPIHQTPQTQQSPANENAGRGGQPSAGQNNSNAMPQNNNEKQQQPANQNAGAGQKNNPSGNEPATTGQGGDRSQQPAARQGSGSDTSGQPADQKSQQGNPNGSNK